MNTHFLMRRISLPFVLACLILAVSTHAQQQPKAGTVEGMGATVDSIQIDATSGVATVRITNISTKDITAYNLSLDVVYSNGRETHTERQTDLLGLMLTIQAAPPGAFPSNGSFHPGETREETVSVAGSASYGAASRVNGTVDAVVYADRTADVKNEAALKRILANRRAAAQASIEALKIIRGNLANANVVDPISASVSGVKQLLAQAKAQPGRLLDTEVLSIISDLNGLSRTPSASRGKSLEEYVTKREARTAKMLASVQIGGDK